MGLSWDLSDRIHWRWITLLNPSSRTQINPRQWRPTEKLKLWDSYSIQHYKEQKPSRRHTSSSILSSDVYRKVELVLAARPTTRPTSRDRQENVKQTAVPATDFALCARAVSRAVGHTRHTHIARRHHLHHTGIVSPSSLRVCRTRKVSSFASWQILCGSFSQV